MAIAFWLSCFFILFPLSVFLNGWAIETLWNWFVAPLGVGPIGLIHALGLSLFCTFLTYHKDDFKKPENNDDDALYKGGAIFGYLILRPLIMVGVGYVLTRFMVN